MPSAMARFEPVRDATREFGTNSYLEVARKRLVDEAGATTEFVVVTRGFYNERGEKHWAKFVTVPDDAALKGWLAETLKEI